MSDSNRAAETDRQPFAPDPDVIPEGAAGIGRGEEGYVSVR